ncbi:hypothetical protein [Flavobacterium sp. WG21]|uniref:hypothetical protein n=1 Tax=Flavobacterium sp. WG21 TaxID=1229487 RepID=UPI00035C1DD3|nr:hypothetical protein [Flavobacterium sp. WG21]
MKTHKFILIRIAIVLGALLIIYNGAYYTLPEYIQQDSFSFIAEIDRIFELSLIFSIVFLLFLLVEIYIFKKRQQTNLRNAAMILSLFITILVIALVYANGIF